MSEFFENKNLIVFIFSIIISNFSISPIRRIGLKYGVIDRYEKRKDFKGKIVRIGGLSIIIGCSISLLLIANLFNIQFDNQLIYLFSVSLLFFLIGFFDDLLTIKPIPRLFLQASSTLFALTFLENLLFPFFQFAKSLDSFNILFLFIGLLITILWIPGVTNAFNWIDGLDGLAGGVSVILYSGLFFVFLSLNLYQYSLYSLAIAGACYGFLIHNYKPASILMGDGGSYFLGFNLAALSLIASNNLIIRDTINSSIFASLFPLILLSVPVLDMFFVILVRIYNLKSPFYPDRNHLHHRLLEFGINYKLTILIILLLNAIAVFSTYLIFSKNELILYSLTFYGILIVSINFLKKFLEGNSK